LREADVLNALRGVLDPELGESVVELGLVQRIACEANGVEVWLGATSPACPVAPAMRAQARQALLALPGVERAEVHAAQDFVWTPGRIAPTRVRKGALPGSPRGSSPGTDSGERLQILERDALPRAETEGVGPESVAPRVPILVLALLALVAASWAGLVRIGFPWMIPQPAWVMAHGPLMVCGFLGTVIGLERAVGLGRNWALLGPAATALGALGLLLGQSASFSALLFSVGSGYLVCLFAVVLRREFEVGSFTMGLGAVCWLVGNLAWFNGAFVPKVVMWWTAFLVLTIAGERLILARFREAEPWKTAAFFGCISLILGSCVIRGLDFSNAWAVLGLGWIALAGWLIRFDVARRTLRREGLPRFTAICLLAGYGWLLFGGLLTLLGPIPDAGLRYDAVLHAMFLGFVISMVFGHAPIIFPSVLNIPIPFRRGFYFHLVLLHVSLAIRIVGDLTGELALRKLGGGLNVVSLAVFLMATLSSAAIARARIAGKRKAG